MTFVEWFCSLPTMSAVLIAVAILVLPSIIVILFILNAEYHSKPGTWMWMGHWFFVPDPDDQTNKPVKGQD